MAKAARERLARLLAGEEALPCLLTPGTSTRPGGPCRRKEINPLPGQRPTRNPLHANEIRPTAPGTAPTSRVDDLVWVGEGQCGTWVEAQQVPLQHPAATLMAVTRSAVCSAYSRSSGVSGESSCPGVAVGCSRSSAHAGRGIPIRDRSRSRVRCTSAAPDARLSIAGDRGDGPDWTDVNLLRDNGIEPTAGAGSPGRWRR